MICRAQIVGDFNNPLQGILNLKVTLFNGNATEPTGYRTTPEGAPLYQYTLPNGFDYIQVTTMLSADLVHLLRSHTHTHDGIVHASAFPLLWL